MRREQAVTSREKLLDKDSEIAKLKAVPDRPILDIQVKEAIIEPFYKRAKCFLRVSVHNSVREVPTNVCGYKLVICIGNDVFESGEPLSLAEYEAGSWEIDEEHPEPWNDWIKLTSKLSDMDLCLILKDLQLTVGNRKEGWIAFHIDGVPPWPTYQEPTGGYRQYIDEDTGQEGWEEETVSRSRTSTVKNVELQMLDAFGNWHHGNREAPLCEGRRTVQEMDAANKRKQDN